LSNISIKGDLREGIKMVVNPSLSWDEIKNLIIDEIKDKEKFFKGINIYIDFQGREIDNTEWEELQKQIYENNGIMLNKDLPKIRIPSSNIAKIIIGPIRSGKLISSKENLLIIGDVNSGAEIICNKSVFVLGKIRGSIWAGYENNDKAIIFALGLEPEKIQIGSYIFDLPKAKHRKAGYFLYIEDGKFKIDTY